jgi:hypothetical protein
MINPVPKIPRKYSTEKIATPFLLLKKTNDIVEKERSKQEIKSKSREI